MEASRPSAPDREQLVFERRRLEALIEGGSSSAEAFLDLARICVALGALPDALQSAASAAAKAPDWNLPVIVLGDALRGLGRRDAAMVAFRRALELDPEDAGTAVKLGNVLSDERRHAEAVELYERASRARADWYVPHLNRGNALAAQGDVPAARTAYEAALRVGGPPGIRLRRDLMLPVMAESATAYASAHERYERALDALAADPPVIANPLSETPASRFFLAFHGLDDRALQEALARIYLAGCPALGWTTPSIRGGIRPSGPRRIAFVSRFLFDHSVGRLCLGLLRRLAARTDCEILSFETAPTPDDAVRAEVARLAKSTEALPGDLQAAREAIAATAPDLVFYPEIGMDPVAYFLAFARLAPVQCATWGHPMTTGIPTIDYYLSCDAAEPAGAEASYSESLVRLGGLPFSYPRPPAPEPPKTRADFGLDEGATLYFLAQNLFKIHPAMDPALAAILAADERAVILLLEGHDPAWGDILRRRLRGSIGKAAERVRFLPRQSHDDYMRLLGLSDVSLDSFPFCGGNTTYQALAMGTPVVTLPGDHLRGRLSLAIYRRMGMTECIAVSVEDYATIALRLGTDRGFAAAIRRRIAEGCSLIFDDPVFLDDAEAFLMTAQPRAG